VQELPLLQERPPSLVLVEEKLPLLAQEKIPLPVQEILLSSEQVKFLFRAVVMWPFLLQEEVPLSLVVQEKPLLKD